MFRNGAWRLALNGDMTRQSTDVCEWGQRKVKLLMKTSTPFCLCIVVLLGSNGFGADGTAEHEEEVRFFKSVSRIREEATTHLITVAEPVRVATAEQLREMESSDDLSLALTARYWRLDRDREAEASWMLPPTEVKEFLGFVKSKVGVTPPLFWSGAVFSHFVRKDDIPCEFRLPKAHEKAVARMTEQQFSGFFFQNEKPHLVAYDEGKLVFVALPEGVVLRSLPRVETLGRTTRSICVVMPGQHGRRTSSPL